MSKKRGSTLAELVIVLAILSMMTIMILSFTVLCNAWVKLGTHRYNLIQDEQNISELLRNFVESLDEKDYFFHTADSGHSLQARRGDDIEYAFYYDPETNTVRYTLPGDKSGAIPVEKLDDVSFYIRPAKNGGRQLIYCTITFTSPTIDAHAKELQGTHRILVATRAAGSHSGGA